MPSEIYQNDKNSNDSIKKGVEKDFRYSSERRTAGKNYVKGPFPDQRRANQVLAKNKLRQLQRNAPRATKVVSQGKLKKVIKGLLSQVDISTDWLFILLFSFGLLKDFVDFVFAATGAIPILGIAGAAIGMIVSFVANLLFLILVVTVLVLVGGSLKNRGLAKYYLGVAMEFIAEALPGISLLPWTVIYVFILYLCVLYDRMVNAAAESTA